MKNSGRPLTKRSGSPRDPVSNLQVGLLVAWLVFVAAALVLTIGLGSRTEVATPFAVPNAYRLLAGTELFLLLLACPLALRKGGESLGLWWAVALLALAAPAVVAAAWMSDCDLSAVAASQCYLVAAAFLVGSLPRVPGAPYWAVVSGLGAGAPLVAFVAEDNLGANLPWLKALSPFWALDRLATGAAPWWQWALTGGAFVLAGLFLRLLRRR